MAPLPESDFRSLLADASRATFVDFVADLWRARGRDVERVGDRLVADGRELRPVVEADEQLPVESAGGRNAVVVTATQPPLEAGSTVYGPDALFRLLRDDVPRDRATDLFESHFGRPFDDSADGDGGAAAAGSPGDDHSPVRTGLRDVFGHPSVVAVAAVVLIVLVASVGVLFVYQPTPATSAPPFEADEPPVDGSYRAVSQVHSTSDESGLSAELVRTYAPGDPAVSLGRLTTRSDDGGTTVADYRRGNVSYSRQSWTDPSAYRSYVDRSGYEPIVRTSNATQSVYLVENGSEVSPDHPIGSLHLGMLAVLAYERDGTTTYEGRDVVRYTPTTGWTASSMGGGRTLRTRDAAGEVLVDEETGALLYADVEVTVVPAETWGDVLLESDVDFDVEYHVVPDVDRPRAPPWVDGLNETATNATVG